MMALNPSGVCKRLSVVLACCALASTVASQSVLAQVQQIPLESSIGRLMDEAETDFSHMLIRQRGSIRSLVFVRDSGMEVLETQLDLRKPQELQFEYLRYLFTSYLFRDQQQDVLIVGLGGGGMIHFLNHIDPKIHIDAVEIDPKVVEWADKYFGVRSGGNVNVVTADGLKYLAETEKKYDVIYMDAFLKPSADTDQTGAPRALRTRRFYEQMQTKLKPGGAVAFNLNPHDGLEDDIREISEAFPQAYVFPLMRFSGNVVLASTVAERASPSELVKRGRALDRRFKTSVRFEEMSRRVRR